VANDGAIVSNIRAILVDDLYAVAVEVEDSSIEVAVKFIPARGGSVGSTSSREGGRVEVSDCGAAVCSEGNVCGAGPSTDCGQLRCRLGVGWGHSPGSLLAEKEVGITDSKGDLAALLSEVAVAQRLEGSKKERGGSW
jgi:hypothetical protein